MSGLKLHGWKIASKEDLVFFFVRVHGFLGLSGIISQKQEQIKGGNDMFVISFLRLTVSLPLSSFQPGDKSRASISKSVIEASQ